MPKLLVGGNWFEPVSAKSLYEIDYENAILRYAPELFPDFICVRFKELVESDYGNAKADLALIDKQYRSWIVVEVELDTHPLRDHVEEQVSKLAIGAYANRHAEALHRERSDLDFVKLKEMMLGEQPKILVLVTSMKPTWAPALARYGASVGVIELFRSERNAIVLRVNGDQPNAVPEQVVALCRVDPMLPNALRILSAAPFAGLDTISLDHEGYSADWKIIRTSFDSWLTPTGRFPLDASLTNFKIIDKGNNDLALREATN